MKLNLSSKGTRENAHTLLFKAFIVNNLDVAHNLQILHNECAIQQFIGPQITQLMLLPLTSVAELVH